MKSLKTNNERMRAVNEVRLIDANALAERVRRYISVAGKDAIAKFIEDEPTVDPWISVADKLPENDDYVVVAYESGKMGRDFFSNIRNDFVFKHGGEITHWMPMPSPSLRDGDNYKVIGPMGPSGGDV